MNDVDDLMAAMTAVINNAEGRSLTDDEVSEYEGHERALNAARKDSEVRARQQAYNAPAAISGVVMTADRPSNPLAYTPSALDSIQSAISGHTSGRFDADQFTNAALTTTTYGQPSVWGSNVLGGPRLLHLAAGIPTASIDAVLAEFPKLVIPAAGASVGEGVSLAEYSSSTGGSLVLGRFGRWTDLSGESLIGADAGAIIAVHALAIARDLDKSLVDAVNTEAGAAIAFDADVVGQIRKSIAVVQDNTGAATVDGICVIVHPDDIALLEDIAPVSGSGIAEGFVRFSGACVYASSSVPTGFSLTANLRDSVRFFSAQGVRTATDTDVKTDLTTVATMTVAGYAIGLTGGSARKNDIRTP